MNKTKLANSLYKANDELLILREKIAVVENENTKISAGRDYWQKRFDSLASKLEGYKEVLDIIFHPRIDIDRTIG